jgi:hypothetical protein
MTEAAPISAMFLCIVFSFIRRIDPMCAGI